MSIIMNCNHRIMSSSSKLGTSSFLLIVYLVWLRASYTRSSRDL